MIIRFHGQFAKRYDKLPRKIQKKVDVVLEKFRKDPFDDTLKNHALKGPMADKRAIYVSGDLRIIFEEYDNYILVIMLDVGTHNQVY